MVLFSVDTADPKDVLWLRERGIPIDKMTTNPTSKSKVMKRIRDEEGRTVSSFDVVDMLLDLTDCPISVETLGTPDYRPETMDPDIFVQEAETIGKYDSRLVVKFPLVAPALVAARALEGMYPVNFTLCFSAHQADLAADYGGTYVSPFLGRIVAELERDDEAEALLRGIIEKYGKDLCSTKVLAASIRNEEQLMMAAKYGADVVTVPMNVIRDMYEAHGEGALAIIQDVRLRRSRRTVSSLWRPTYSKDFNYSEMQPWQRELLDAGVRTFLDDARSVGYSVLPKAA